MASITTRTGKGSPLTNAEVDSNFTELNTELGLKEVAANKGVAGGYASLDGTGRVPSGQLPSYVDDVLEFANLAAFPATGETGKIYVALDSNKVHRWSGSAYVEISASPGSTDSVPEGSTNLYFTQARARASVSGTAPISYNSETGAFSHAASGVTAGTYGSATAVPVVTINEEGHVTGVSTSAISGSLTFTGDVTGSGTTGGTTTLTLANSGVTGGTYSNASITVDAKGRVTSASSGDAGGVTSFNTRTGAVSLTSGDVTGALGFTPYDSTNPSGYITSSALSSYLPLSGGTLTGAVTITDALGSTTINGAGVSVNRANVYLGTASAGQALNLQTDDFRVRDQANTSTYFSATASGASVNGNVVLHAGNYGSGYFKTINGSSIIGTGDLSVSASVSGLTLTNSSNGINPDNVTQNQIGYNTSVSLFGQTDGGLYSSAYSSAWIHQIYGDFRSGQIAVRGKNNGTWQSWRTVLDSGNYTSYSPGSGSSWTFGEVYANGWFRNNNSGQGLYNQATANHFYSDGQYWNVAYSGTTGIRFRNGHAGTVLGYLYAETSGNFGLLHNGGGWAVQVNPGGGGTLHGSWGGTFAGTLTGTISTSVNTSTIGRHLEASSGWTVGGTTLFLGWSTGSVLIGNNANGVHDSAYNGGVNRTYMGNPVYAQSYRTWGNVAGTGEASFHPSGIYSTGTNWLYGTIYMNGNVISNAGYYELTGGFRFNNGGSGYAQFSNWTRLDGYYGFFSGTNSAHFYPNNQDYGSWRMDGTRNGWYGLAFGTGMTLMMNDNECGVHRDGQGWRFYVSGTSLFCNGNITAYWSDERLKENIRPLDGAMNIISSLESCRFTWNALGAEIGMAVEQGKEEIGMIAQRVQEVLPDAVVVNESANKPNGEKYDYLTINYNKITPVILQAVKELNDELQAVKQQLAQIKSTVH